jgi:hypothetical protein
VSYSLEARLPLSSPDMSRIECLKPSAGAMLPVPLQHTAMACGRRVAIVLLQPCRGRRRARSSMDDSTSSGLWRHALIDELSCK